MSRLVVVSNRSLALPGARDAIARALLAELADRQGLWFGPSGETAAVAAREPVISERGRVTFAAVDLEAEAAEGHYRGFCKGVLWPLLHFRLGQIEFHEAHYRAYRHVNEHLADLLTPMLRPDDLVWVQDYHLIPLATRLRQNGFTGAIGLFMHAPFPPPELFEVLPIADELLADFSSYTLVGFQTEEDEHAFGLCFTRFQQRCAARPHEERAHHDPPQTHVCPAGIDAETTAEAARKAVGSSTAKRLIARFTDRRLILGLDDVDLIRGLPQRLASLSALFAHSDGPAKDATYLQLVAPTPIDPNARRKARKAFEAGVRQIAEDAGADTHKRLVILDKAATPNLRLALCRAATIGLVTPLREGMHIMAKEFIAAQDPERPGVLVLSQFTGAARQLDSSVLVNPYDIDNVVHGIETALAMPLRERQERWRSAFAEVRDKSSSWWSHTMIEAITDAWLRRTHQVRIHARTVAAAQCLF